MTQASPLPNAPTIWTAPAPLKGDEFQVWLHTDKAERMYRREDAVLFVSHKDLERIDHRVNEGDGDATLHNVTQDFCKDWMSMQAHPLPPHYVPASVKHHLAGWEEINNAKPPHPGTRAPKGECGVAGALSAIDFKIGAALC
ncbi:MAG: hypothetical protein JKY34_12785 [Kordiimonadaceae bacterium]|nr:hypothetical protein [Kordiimonadaceae bacterium]